MLPTLPLLSQLRSLPAQVLSGLSALGEAGRTGVRASVDAGIGDSFEASGEVSGVGGKPAGGTIGADVGGFISFEGSESGSRTLFFVLRGGRGQGKAVEVTRAIIFHFFFALPPPPPSLPPHPPTPLD